MLFRRTHSGMVLTAAGRAFLPHADRAMEAIRSGGSLVRELEHGVIGELALAVAPAVSAYVLPEILVRFTERHPDVRLLVRTGHSEEIVDLVAHGQVELGIVRQMRDARVRSRPLYEDELVLVARPDHPFAMAGEVDVSEISHAQLILFDRTSSYYDVTNALFRVAGVVPRGVTEVDNIEAAKRMVERGLGVALLPGTAVADTLIGRLAPGDRPHRHADHPPTDRSRRATGSPRGVSVPRYPVGTPRPHPGAHPSRAADPRHRLNAFGIGRGPVPLDRPQARSKASRNVLRPRLVMSGRTSGRGSAAGSSRRPGS